MVRSTLENVLSADRLDVIFEENAEEQYVGDLLLSTVAEIMGLVVCQIHPSVNAAYKDREEEIGVTVKSVYDKLKGIETPVSRAMVRDTTLRMQAIIKQTEGIAESLLPGYRTKIVDGNHLRRTDRRIGELRELNVAPLPVRQPGYLERSPVLQFAKRRLSHRGGISRNGRLWLLLRFSLSARRVSVL